MSADLADFVVPAVSVLLGALVAFWLEREQRKTEETRRQVGQINSALFVLSEMWSVQRQYQKEIVDVHGRDAGAWIRMRATIPHESGELGFSLEGLGFMLGSGGASILQETFLEERRYRLFLSMVNARSQYLMSEAFPRLEAAGAAEGVQYDGEAVERVVGPRVHGMLRELTNGIIAHVDENVLSAKATFMKLRAYATPKYTDATFINCDFNDRGEGEEEPN